MKMAILELEYKNIRKITALKLPFTKADGSVISNNFIMMANGTGKTTTMELILTEIQNAEGKRGTSSSLSNLRTRQSDIDAIRDKLRARCEKLREEIAAFEAEKVEKEKQRQELDKSYEKLNQEKNDILKEQQKNRGEIDVKITSILGIIKSPYLLSESLCARMFELGNSMKKLKLPKTIAKDFFTELASADRCVCDRCIGERERTAILKRADQYLGSDQQSVLNTVKSSLMDSVYDERLKKAFEELEELRAQANRLDTRFTSREEFLDAFNVAMQFYEKKDS